MTDPRDDLRDKVARAIADYELPVGPGWQDRWRDYFGTADAAIAVALEEAAKMIETRWAHGTGKHQAAAIRAMIKER